jgi:hypothetical protein
MKNKVYKLLLPMLLVAGFQISSLNSMNSASLVFPVDQEFENEEVKFVTLKDSKLFFTRLSFFAEKEKLYVLSMLAKFHLNSFKDSLFAKSLKSNVLMVLDEIVSLYPEGMERDVALFILGRSIPAHKTNLYISPGGWLNYSFK